MRDSTRPTIKEIGIMMHALREAVGAFVIRVAMLEDEDLSERGRTTRDAMLSDVERMARALRAMTDAFDLEQTGSTPLALLNPRPSRSTHARSSTSRVAS